MSTKQKQTKFRLGSTGDRVRLIQTMLATLGYSLGSIDGTYGQRTARAVRQFQIVWGLYRDGEVGPETLKTLFGRFSSEFQVAIRDTAVGGHPAANELTNSGVLPIVTAPDTPIAGHVAVGDSRAHMSEDEIRRWLESDD